MDIYAPAFRGRHKSNHIKGPGGFNESVKIVKIGGCCHGAGGGGGFCVVLIFYSNVYLATLYILLYYDNH